MGAAALENQVGTPIDNNLIAMLITNQTSKVIDKIESAEQPLTWTEPINFKGDTLLHYACAKNSVPLVQYLVKKFAELPKKMNNQNQYPDELTTSEEVKRICNHNNQPRSTEIGMK